MSAKEDLIDRINTCLTEDQASLINDLVRLCGNKFMSKADMLKLAGIPNDGHIDTAVPNDYVNRVKDILPNFNTYFHVYDYRDNIHGTFLNVAEGIINNLTEQLQK